MVCSFNRMGINCYKSVLEIFFEFFYLRDYVDRKVLVYILNWILIMEEDFMYF